MDFQSFKFRFPVILAAGFVVLFSSAARADEGQEELQARPVQRVIVVQGNQINPELGQPSKDQLSEMGEMESLKIQMQMDRLSKAQQTLSNLSKKMSESQQAIVENLKGL